MLDDWRYHAHQTVYIDTRSFKTIHLTVLRTECKYKSTLTLSLFIEVHEPSQDSVRSLYISCSLRLHLQVHSDYTSKFTDYTHWFIANTLPGSHRQHSLAHSDYTSKFILTTLPGSFWKHSLVHSDYSSRFTPTIITGSFWIHSLVQSDYRDFQVQSDYT